MSAAIRAKLSEAETRAASLACSGRPSPKRLPTLTVVAWHAGRQVRLGACVRGVRARTIIPRDPHSGMKIHLGDPHGDHKVTSINDMTYRFDR